MRWSFKRSDNFRMFPLTDAANAALDAGGYDMGSDPQLSAVLEALRDDKFILAVKEFRIATGVGMRTAKEAVEAIVADLAASPGNPD